MSIPVQVSLYNGLRPAEIRYVATTAAGGRCTHYHRLRWQAEECGAFPSCDTCGDSGVELTGYAGSSLCIPCRMEYPGPDPWDE